MTKPINQDIMGMKDDFFKGLSLRECIYGGLALAFGAGIIGYLGIYKGWNINLAVTLAIPVIAFFGACGFYTYKGMTFSELMKKKIKRITSPALTYSSVNDFSNLSVTTSNSSANDNAPKNFVEFIQMKVGEKNNA